MVFDRPQQITAARASVDSFFAQKWPHKELVIYNATRHRLLPWWWRRRNTQEIRLRQRLAGQMLALCAENANGEWLMNWMPDCWYDPDYVGTLMRYRHKSRLVTASNKQVYALKDQMLLIVTNDSVLCWSAYRHFPLNFESPQPLTEQVAVNKIDNPAKLIVKFAREIV